MELRTIGDDFQPVSVVEGYQSLIWTDRYRDAGDFELKSADINRMKNLLPVGSMVAIKTEGPPECKLVESHEIDSDDDGESILTIKGRSWETFFENRIANEEGYGMFLTITDPSLPIPPYRWKLGQEQQGLNGEAASAFAYEIIQYKSMVASETFEYIPNFVCVVNSDVTMAAGKTRRWIRPKIENVYEVVKDILAIDDLGWKTELPALGQTKLTLRIFQGTDLSGTVTLSVQAGHFEQATYTWTNKEYYNSTVAISQWDSLRYTTGSPDGMDRRFGYVDASDITYQANPGADFDQKKLEARSISFLKKHKQTTSFSGIVSPNVPYVYIKDYNIGDILRVVGEYGVNQKMRVSEYIRIEDEKGERGYPTLELP